MKKNKNQSIHKELDVKAKELKNAYLSSNKDAGQREAMKEWENTAKNSSEEE